jgi:hypothetical protein
MLRTIFSIAYNNNNNNKNYHLLFSFISTVNSYYYIRKHLYSDSFSLLSQLINVFYDAHTPFIIHFLQTLIVIRIWI